MRVVEIEEESLRELLDELSVLRKQRDEFQARGTEQLLVARSAVWGSAARNLREAIALHDEVDTSDGFTFAGVSVEALETLLASFEAFAKR
jgi:hypothetical protein